LNYDTSRLPFNIPKRNSKQCFIHIQPYSSITERRKDESISKKAGPIPDYRIFTTTPTSCLQVPIFINTRHTDTSATIRLRGVAY